MKKIILTGGGTAGHVTPNLALLPLLKEHGYEVRYIGSYTGIEKTLVEQAGIPYDGISSGKLRRYFDWKNFTDPFRVLKGYGEARKLLKKYQPEIVFSKGGFVAVPVVMAAKHLHIPVIIHDREAHGDCFETVLRYPEVKGVFHSYSGSAEMAKEAVKLGCYISFSGTVSFKNAPKVRAAAAVVPKDRVLMETDCPYLAPHPHRGEMNHSALMRFTLEALAAARGETPEETEKITTENALRFFGISL